MLLSNQQKYVLEILQKLGCMTRGQLIILLRARFCSAKPEIAEKLTDAILRQLRYGNYPLRVEGELVKTPGHSENTHMLEAIDVMLELTDGVPLDFSAGQAPILLRFTADGARISLFAVLHVASVRAALNGASSMPPFGKGERVVVMLDNNTPPTGFAPPGDCFFTRRQTDGKHRFYIQEEPQATH